MENNFDKLIEAYKQLDTESKCKEIISALKEIIAIYDYVSKSNGLDNPIILNKEVKDVNNPDATFDDYLEAIYAYIMTLEDISGNLLSGIFTES